MDLDIRYVAGLIDADGWISISKWLPNKSYAGNKAYIRYQLFVGLGQVHRPLVKQLKDQFGGMLNRNASAHHRNSKNRIFYEWRLSSVNAANFLTEVLPWLFVKKDQAKLAIEFQQHVTQNRSTRYSLEERQVFYEKRETMKSELKQMKLISFDIPRR